MPYVENSDYARIYGDMESGVWVGTKGTTLPTTLTDDPVAPFEATGWLSEAGIQFAIDKDVTEHNALQGGSLVRKKVGKVVQKITFECLEETALVLGLVYADQPFTYTGTGTDIVAKQDIVTNQGKTVERAVVVDAVDGDIRDRYCISAMDLTFMGEVSLASNTDIRVYRFEGTIIAGAAGYHLTNSPGVIADAP